MSISGKSIRILLIDDHATVRAGLSMLIESLPGMKIVGEVGRCVDGLNIAVREQPDIILLDLDMGKENGLDFIPGLLDAAPKARIIILTGMREQEMQMRAVRLGAVGIVLKERAADHLIKAINKVYEGELWLDRAMLAEMVTNGLHGGKPRQSDPEAVKISTLTERERQIISLIGEGLRNKQIAARLFISETTVRHYLTGIFSKLNVSDRLELAIYAYRHSLAKLPVVDPNLQKNK